MNKRVIAAFIITSLALTLTASAQSARTFKINNMSGKTITGIYLSPVGMNQWGKNILTGGKIENRKSFVYSEPAGASNCKYDVRFEGNDNLSYTLHNLNLCSAAGVDLNIPSYGPQKQSTNQKTERANKAR